MIRAFTACVLATSFFGATAFGNEVDLNFAQRVSVFGSQVPYQLDVTLTETDATRIGINAILNVSDVQQAVSTALDGYVIEDTCNLYAKVAEADIVAADDVFQIVGVLKADLFSCDRQGLKPVDRGDLILSQTAGIDLKAGIVVRNNCVAFRLSEFDIALRGAIELTEEQRSHADALGDFVLAAVQTILERQALCPELPAELASLAPRYDAGGTAEIGDGGAAVFLTGSVDVSTRTILSIMKVLQNAGVLPPEP